MESSASYQYTSLTERGGIRLISLQPSQTLDQPLRCSLIPTSLNKCEQDLVEGYTALSYVWGPATARGEILVDGMKLEITASLDLALRHVREPLRTIQIWADGICINQADIEEKGHQVAQMGAIYETAQHTIIFLGLATEHSDAILGAVSSSRVNKMNNTSWSSSWQSFNHGQNSSYTPDEVLVDILSRPWFTRVWVLQELVLSVDPWIQCGLKRCKWDHFSFFKADVDVPSGSTLQSLLKAQEDMHMLRISYRTQHPNYHEGPAPLLSALQARRGMGATDPRDFIYAHLGMTNYFIRQSVKTDYSKCCWHLYTEIARWLLKYLPHLDILLLNAAPDHTNERARLPSWVPDWSRPQNSFRNDMPTRLSSSEIVPRPIEYGTYSLLQQAYKQDFGDPLYCLLHQDSSLLIMDSRRWTTIASILPPIDRTQLQGCAWLPNPIPPNDVRVIMPEPNNIWELYEDATHHRVMHNLFDLMMNQVLPDIDRSEVWSLKTRPESRTSFIFESGVSGHGILCEIARQILLGNVADSTNLSRHDQHPVVRDMVLMLLLLARQYLSGASVAIMTDGSVSVVPEWVEVGDICSYHQGGNRHSPEESTTKSYEMVLQYPGVGLCGLTDVQGHWDISTFLRLDQEFMKSEADIAVIRELEEVGFKQFKPPRVVMGPYRIVAVGDYTYTLSIHDIRKARLPTSAPTLPPIILIS